MSSPSPQTNRTRRGGGSAPRAPRRRAREVLQERLRAHLDGGVAAQLGVVEGAIYTKAKKR